MGDAIFLVQEVIIGDEMSESKIKYVIFHWNNKQKHGDDLECF
ncbi:hypothetical protein SDC9_162433 [bioreactor metagenome]|uniref:Uncharacterized protein n=1 Tax=bioreactor metagenome TaxID=1076179 RepID=A0A645FSD6_9ZZZZ